MDVNRLKLQPQSLFTNYRIESANNNEINLFFRVSDLLYISKVAQQATNIMINLRLRDGQPYLNWKMTLQDRNGSSMESVQELGVSLISPDRMVYIKEPRTMGIPHTYILLPNVSTLKPVAERLKSLSKYLTLSANMNGVFKVAIETVNCECEAIFEGLENPQLEGQQPNEDVNEFAHVRIASDDFVSFLNCYHLDPQNVVCSITDELQLVFYVYMTIDTYQAHEAPIRPIHSPQTIMTCHVPAYYE
ncbi:hypothetical protein BCV71DRAFT_79918 [Rhizopus microsporus]|uniref:Checkpoint protein n=1 Tax=Rhizopus microsporus TaxID=58291 RepID=A0A1X0S947_RHIZD|nr:hypothetical protein BCV71DRAFT_79918 [Rhizopus microsporus]